MKGSPATIALVLRRRAHALEKSVRDAERESGKRALLIARQLSSGPYSQAQLRAMGHPYAVRQPRPPQDPAIINVHTGRFRAGWVLRGPRKTAKGLVTRLVNTSPHSGRLERGTARMIPRPIRARILAQLARERRRLYERALRGALSAR